MQCLDGGETQDIQRAPDFITSFADAEAGFSGNESRVFASRLQEQSRLVENSWRAKRVSGSAGARAGMAAPHVFPTRQFDRANRFALPGEWTASCLSGLGLPATNNGPPCSWLKAVESEIEMSKFRGSAAARAAYPASMDVKRQRAPFPHSDRHATAGRLQWLLGHGNRSAAKDDIAPGNYHHVAKTVGGQLELFGGVSAVHFGHTGKIVQEMENVKFAASGDLGRQMEHGKRTQRTVMHDVGIQIGKMTRKPDPYFFVSSLSR